MRDEAARAIDARLIRPAIARIGVGLLGIDGLLILLPAASTTASAITTTTASPGTSRVAWRGTPSLRRASRVETSE